MKIYDSFQQFWNEFTTTKPNAHGFHDWAVVQILHVDDETYSKQRGTPEDELGFQPLSLKLADPLTKTVKQILIKDVDSNTANAFREYVRKLYIEQLGSRFGSFTPDATHAYTEYENWNDFYTVWLERQSKPVFMHNIPLLFDHTPKVELWMRKQTGQTVLPYQRLLITTYFVHKNQFFSFFIKDVDDAEAERIKLLTQSRIGLNLDQLFKPVVR